MGGDFTVNSILPPGINTDRCIIRKWCIELPQILKSASSSAYANVNGGIHPPKNVQPSLSRTL
jgi:hypothetical protein